MQTSQSSVQQNVGASSAGAFANLSRAEQLQLSEDRHAAMGRHIVEQMNVSVSTLLGAAAVSGVAGAVLGAAAGGSWRTAVLAGAAGVTLGALGADFIARPITALEHAQNELAQTRTFIDSLLKLGMDQPEHRSTGHETVLIKQLADRYQESSADILLLARLLAQGNQTLEDILMNFRGALTDYNLSVYDVLNLGVVLFKMDTVEQLKANPEFHRAMANSNIVAEKYDEIARVMFAYNRMLMTKTNLPRGLTPEALYRKLCLERHNYFKDRLEGDVVQLERDIEVLKAMAAEEKKQRLQAEA